jgi:hypothetical protein
MKKGLTSLQRQTGKTSKHQKRNKSFMRNPFLMS